MTEPRQRKPYPPLEPLIGRVASEPVARTANTRNGPANLVEFRVAKPRSFSKGDADFVQVTIWNESLAHKAENEVFVGAWISLLGEYRTEEWVDQEGETRVSRKFTAAGGGITQWWAIGGGGANQRRSRPTPTERAPEPAEPEEPEEPEDQGEDRGW